MVSGLTPVWMKSGGKRLKSLYQILIRTNPGVIRSDRVNGTDIQITRIRKRSNRLVISERTIPILSLSHDSFLAADGRILFSHPLHTIAYVGYALHLLKWGHFTSGTVIDLRPSPSFGQSSF